jgi:hypothetical protein
MSIQNEFIEDNPALKAERERLVRLERVAAELLLDDTSDVSDYVLTQLELLDFYNEVNGEPAIEGDDRKRVKARAYHYVVIARDAVKAALEEEISE